VTLFSVVVAFASMQGYKLVLTNSIVPLLSVVVRMTMAINDPSFLKSLFLGWTYPRLSVSFSCSSTIID
jgi:uncharacterized membrane protein YgaE (UPF0421/DUF939 family)